MADSLKSHPSEEYFIARTGGDLKRAIEMLGGHCPLSNLQLGRCIEAAKVEHYRLTVKAGIARHRLAQSGGNDGHTK